MSETSGTGKSCLSSGQGCYQKSCATCRRTYGNETKAKPIIRIPILNANWGYPKQERQIGYEITAMAVAPENPARVRSVRSSMRRLMTFTRRRNAVVVY